MKKNTSWIRYTLLTAGAIIMVFPMIYMLTSSLTPNDLTFTYPPKVFPPFSELTGANYTYILSNKNFFLYLMNTLITAVFSTTASALISSMLAFTLARFRFPGRRILFSAIMAVMLVPGLALIVPQFELAVKMKLLNTLRGVALFYTAWTIPFSTFLIKGFIDSIPYEMDESIYMDGGSSLTVYINIILPMASPSIAAASIFNFLFPFEELAWSQTILRSDHLRTIPVAITQFFQAHNRTDWGLVMAMTCLAMVPVILFYTALQKYFVKGITTGAVKE